MRQNYGNLTIFANFFSIICIITLMTANEIRESFKSFFASKGHQIVPSAPMVIKDDPTLMFTNAGMNQFKDIILGNTVPQYRRVADSQKCLRASGKHNDLEEVGHDTYHHTMFEMLGNWSFGDYFKKEAIDWAWEYLVDVLHLNPADLYATVFEGSPSEGIERDNEAASFWERHLPKDHILNGNKHDNFWQMGDTGPCGPCSEIHMDSRSAAEKAAASGASLVNKDHPQVIEIWNIVFMQYDRRADGTLAPLPAKVIDTGMGFERLVRTLQGKTSNYDTDVFQPLIHTIEQLSDMKYVPEDLEIPESQEKTNIAMRVVADHVRTIAFSVADGQLPGNAKAGYVIRRILRRAVRYGYTFLGQRQAFMYRLIPTLTGSMGDAYPELKAQQTLIERVIREEEEAFLRTLDTGIRLLDRIIADARQSGKTVVSGTEAFTLYDTYGFPLDLTELILRENGLTADIDEFNAEMKKQKERARNAAHSDLGDWVVLREGETRFVGYDTTEHDCHILRYRRVTQKNRSYWQIVLDVTPFYAESGGQVGDIGVLVCDDGNDHPVTINITDTKKENGLTVHITSDDLTTLPLDSDWMACVDTDKRAATAANHSCTHLLDEALRTVLGSHVEQRGSLVNAEGLRFDFSHFQKVMPEEIRQVEHLVNAKIRANVPLTDYRDLPIDQARELGAIALFGEKYGDKVRVVQFGSSVEFCGGTHVRATGQIGMMKILSESSVAAGVRRIEAVTGAKVEEVLDHFQDEIDSLRQLFTGAHDLHAAISKILDEHSALKRQIEEAQHERALALADELAKNANVTASGVRIVTARLPLPADVVKDIVFRLRNQSPENTLVVVGSVFEGKPMLTVSASDDLVQQHGVHAGQLVREAAKLIQGGGGGQPHFATAGGKNPDALPVAIDKVVELAGV